ncbi:MAG: hypothetical protein LC792_06720, partial [Actinobacteria bacterium]|nr:hypothetical protein [Actinomycetota bacterium]
MNRTLQAVKEFLRPTSVRHHSLPPLEAGLRPNSRLDAAVPLTPPGDYEVDDVLPVSADRWWFSAGTGVFAWEKG